MGALGWVALTSGTAVPSWAISAWAVNSMTFSVQGPVSGSATFALRGYVLIL